MRTFTVALATALLLWTFMLLQAQTLQQLILPGFSKNDTIVANDADHSKKAAAEKYNFQSAYTSLGSPAGQKATGLSKREADSLQQIMLIRKKF